MRECGQCVLCCTLCLVSELDKAEGVPCVHCKEGCLIYEGRPAACEAYECAWKKYEVPEFMRPDLCGVMVETYPLMMAALLAPDKPLHSLSCEVIAVFDMVASLGLPVIATGQFAKLPKGMTRNEAEEILIKTVKEHRV